MEILRRDGQYDQLRRNGQKLMDMHRTALSNAGIDHQTCGDPTLFDVYFTTQPCLDYRSARHLDPNRATTWNATLRANGVFKSPSKMYPSLALTKDDFVLTKDAMTLAAHAIAAAM
jgi:glutamate-1-semialdehyde 2,1-aminomutase